jgi:hypothetical protein
LAYIIMQIKEEVDVVTFPYREETPPGWSEAVERTWRIEEVPQGVRLHGVCPTCDHESETQVVVVTVAPGARTDGESKSVASEGAEPVLVVCDCSAEHAGRPGERRGCGRAGYLNLIPDES